jgi:hypothetical protein
MLSSSEAFWTWRWGVEWTVECPTPRSTASERGREPGSQGGMAIELIN